MSTVASSTSRIASLDQFRGYTVAGMFFVNLVGYFAITPILLTHKNTFCSYSDTIMPQFFFAVGFAFRLTFGRRTQSEGLAAAYGHVVRRMFGLALISIVLDRFTPHAGNWTELTNLGVWGAVRTAVYSSWWGPLMHIAVTSLWVLPVIRAGAPVRIAFMIASAVLYLALSHWFYFDWVMGNSVDGGPLGFMAWTIPTLVGTLACDMVAQGNGQSRLWGMFGWAAALMMLGYVFSCGTTLYTVAEAELDSQRERSVAPDPVIPQSERLAGHSLSWAELPFVPTPDPPIRQHNFWMMSQRGATLSYHVFAAGFSLAVYALFFLLCDVWGWQLGLFRTLGSNALAGFIAHELIASAVKPFVPRDAPFWYLTLGFVVYFGLIYLFLRHLEKSKIYLKL